MKVAALAVIATLATAAAPGGSQAPEGGQAPQAEFRAGVDIVSLNVTVTDGRNRYISGLGASDFHVYEDGVRQDVSFFAGGQQPIVLSLVLDSSASMLLTMPTLQKAAVNFVRRLTPQDLAQVIDFDTRVVVREGFTADQPALESAIEALEVGGSTALYDAVYIALKDLAQVRATHADALRRQALIVFSDGEDTTSLLDFEEVLDLAKRLEPNIYTILLRGSDMGAAGFRTADFVMRQLAAETGGRSFTPGRIQDLSSAYAEIADELSNQYTLGYVSTNPRRDGAWRRLTVQVAHGGAAARTRRGYFAPADH